MFCFFSPFYVWLEYHRKTQWRPSRSAGAPQGSFPGSEEFRAQRSSHIPKTRAAAGSNAPNCVPCGRPAGDQLRVSRQGSDRGWMSLIFCEYMKSFERNVSERRKVCRILSSACLRHKMGLGASHLDKQWAG